MQVPVKAVEPVEVHDLLAVIHDTQHGEVLNLGEVQPGEVAVPTIEVFEFPDRALPYLPEDGAASLDELAAELLREHSLGQSLAQVPTA